jgi:hypothetical protein
MCSRLLSFVAFSFLSSGVANATPTKNHYDIRPFKVDLSKGVPRMLRLIKDGRLPDKPEYPGIGSSLGIDLDVLKDLRKEWLNDFNWQKEQDSMNKYEILEAAFSCLPTN